MTKKNAPKFDFGPVPASLKKALDILKSDGKLAKEATPELLLWAEAEVVREEMRRVLIIAQHYKIPPFYSPDLGPSLAPTFNAHSFLLLRKLATDFIGGFSPLRRKGNPRNAVGEHGELVAFIDAEMENKEVSLSQAIERARKKGAPWHGIGRKEIERDYHRGKEGLARELAAIKAALAQMAADEKERAERGVNALGQPRGLLG